MRTSKTWALVALAALLALVCLASPLAGANPPAAKPAQQGVHVAASVAPLLQYQGRLLDAPTGDPVADGDHTMVFRIYNVETEGTALWTETKDVPVANGLFSTVLGDTTALDQALFNGQALWLGIKVGADSEAAPRQPLLPVAYALGLVPGAVIDINDGAGSGLDADLLDGQDSGDFAGASHEHDARYYTEGEADGRFLNSTGPDAIAGSSADPILEVNQSGDGYGLAVYNANGYGVWSEANGPFAAVLGYNTGTGMGVYGHSDGNIAVYGYSDTGYGGLFYSNSGTAMQALGDANVTGDLAVGGNVTGAYNTSLPIAFGVVNTDGTLASGTSNISSVWSSSRYEITISGHSYYYADYVTTVTTFSGCSHTNSIRTSSYVTTVTTFSGCSHTNSIRTSSQGGKLLVYFYDSPTTSVQCFFQFVTFKP